MWLGSNDRSGRICLSSITFAVIVSACTPALHLNSAVDTHPAPKQSEIAQTDASIRERASMGIESDATGVAQSEAVIRLGTGKLINEPVRREQSVQNIDDGVTLNFEASSLRQFIKVMFEELLNENYLIDPQVKGKVTLNTSRPVRKEALMGILESVLHVNGAAVVHDQGLYKIIALQGAQGAMGVTDVGQDLAPGNSGYGIQIVPLLHVAAREIEKIVKPLMP